MWGIHEIKLHVCLNLLNVVEFQHFYLYKTKSKSTLLSFFCLWDIQGGRNAVSHNLEEKNVNVLKIYTFSFYTYCVKSKCCFPNVFFMQCIECLLNRLSKCAFSKASILLSWNVIHNQQSTTMSIRIKIRLMQTELNRMGFYIHLEMLNKNSVTASLSQSTKLLEKG